VHFNLNLKKKKENAFKLHHASVDHIASATTNGEIIREYLVGA
jgi:hypothetical protein